MAVILPSLYDNKKAKKTLLKSGTEQLEWIEMWKNIQKTVDHANLFKK